MFPFCKRRYEVYREVSVSADSFLNIDQLLRSGTSIGANIVEGGLCLIRDTLEVDKN